MIVFILGGIILLGVCIVIHELGHLLAGKLVGIKAQTFSIGYGKGIWKKQINDTTWQITGIPLGGYVRFYGDDYTSDEKVPGGFFSAPPLKRMIPVLGGPLANLLLGFVLFIVLNAFFSAPAPTVQLWEEAGNDSPAYRDGLRNGDKILAINGEQVVDFYDIKNIITLAGGQQLRFQILRDGEKKEVLVSPNVDPAGRASIGIRMPGDRFIEVNYPFKDVWSYRFYSLFSDVELPASLKALPYLKDGDVILSVEGQKPGSIYELQNLLGRYHGETVTVQVRRRTMSWLTPWITDVIDIEVPTTGEYAVDMSNIYDLKYNEPLPDQSFYSQVHEHQRALSEMQFAGLPALSYEKMHTRFAKKSTGVQFSVGEHPYNGNIQSRKIGLFGFRAGSVIETSYSEYSPGIAAVMNRSFEQTYQNIAIYPAFFKKIFSGRVSFIDNAMGPVGMFAVAGVVIKYGLRDYLQLMAAISIALMVMNLLPFPVVDGGHIVLFAIEAISGKKPTAGVVEAIYRFGFTVLLFFGLWVMYRDVLFFIGL